MSFYDLLKGKYFNEFATDKVEPRELEKIVETNLWPADFIERNGKSESIYSSGVSVVEIFEFFKVRMPWVKLKINNPELLEKNPGELLAFKFVVFHQLAGLLSEVHTNFSNAMGPETPFGEGVKGEKWIH